MDFLMHLEILRFCKTINITKPQLIRQIYALIKEHEGKDFKDINDLMEKLYPPRPHNVRRKHGQSPFYTTPSKDETH